MEKKPAPYPGHPDWKAKNKKQIAAELGIHPNTLGRYLKATGFHVKRGIIPPPLAADIKEKVLRYMEERGGK